MSDVQPLDPTPRHSHPQGLWVLFITEMWERFSYYGMRALLVLYLISSTTGENPGFGWTNEDAYWLYGLYTWAVYTTPIFGGWLADKFLGTHRSMLIGGWIIAAGHVTLACTEFFGITAGDAVTLQTGPGALLCFLGGLLLIIVGTGFFKPCVSVMVGQLYGEHDPRRDSGFTIFYMGINLGAFFSPLVAGTLGEEVGWHWGFGAAAVGMLAGLFFYQHFRPKYLAGIGDPPREKGSLTTLVVALLAVAALAGVAVLLAVRVLPLMREHDLAAVFWGVLAALATAVIVGFVLRQKPGERGPLGVVFILSVLGNIFFWSAFEQAGSSMNVFAKEQTDRTLWGLWEDGFPASWYQSVNPAAILLFAPFFAWLWTWLNRRNMNPSTPMKFALGLYLLGLAFLAMVFGSWQARGVSDLAGPHWLLITYVIITWGELCFSPVGLSMVTRLSPGRLQSLMMGVWFFTSALANFIAGALAVYSTRFASGEETFLIEGLPGFFLMLVVFPIGAGLLLTVLTPLLKKMMHGAE